MLVVLLVIVSAAFDPARTPSAALVVMVALQLLHSLPLRWQRHRLLRRHDWILFAQALLLPWAGPGGLGLIGATILLVVRGRLRWALFAAVLAAAGLEIASSPLACVNAVVNALAQGLVLYGVTRLGQLRVVLDAARNDLAAGSIAAERERAGRDLDAVLGGTLSAIVSLAAAGRLTEILSRARDGAAMVRRTAEAPGPSYRPDDLTPRLAIPILIAAHAGFLAVAGLHLWPLLGSSVGVWAALATLAVVGLQLHHSWPRPLGSRPRYVRLTLPIQLAFAALTLALPLHALPQLIGLPLGSLLLLRYGGRRWITWSLGGAVVLVAAGSVAARGATVPELLSGMFDVIAIAAMVWALALHTELVAEAEETRFALADIALIRERRRITREVHDLLGQGLMAIVVRAELALRVPERAEAELADIARLAERALADLRGIPGADVAQLSLQSELESARAILIAAGVAVTVDRTGESLEPGVDQLFAVVLREAVANVLRHSKATYCAIEVHSTPAEAVLRVVNDRALPATQSRGQGTGNLAARMAAAGGRLIAMPTADGGYSLVALQPAGLGRDADGVQPVPGVQLGDGGAEVVPHGPLGQVQATGDLS